MANPNNPTGTAAPPEAPGRLRRRRSRQCRRSSWTKPTSNFWTNPWICCPRSAAGAKPNLILLRTFSKIYGLAGLRLGYGIGHPDFIAELEKIRQPFNVNAIAQAGALAALDDTAHAGKTRRLNARGLKFYARAFRKLGLQIRSFLRQLHPRARG